MKNVKPLVPGDIIVFPTFRFGEPIIYWLFVGVINEEGELPRFAQMFVLHTGRMPQMELHDVETWERL